MGSFNWLRMVAKLDLLGEQAMALNTVIFLSSYQLPVTPQLELEPHESLTSPCQNYWLAWPLCRDYAGRCSSCELLCTKAVYCQELLSLCWDFTSPSSSSSSSIFLNVFCIQTQPPWVNDYNIPVTCRGHYFTAVHNFGLLQSFCILFCDEPWASWGKVWHKCHICGWALQGHLFFVL